MGAHARVCDAKVEWYHSCIPIIDLLRIIESTEVVHLSRRVRISYVHIHSSIKGAVVVGLVQNDVSLEFSGRTRTNIARALGSDCELETVVCNGILRIIKNGNEKESVEGHVR